MNSFQHGLTSLKVFPDSSQPEYEALAARFTESFRPDGLEQERLVETMLRAHWNLRRYAAIEEQVWQTLADENPGQSLAQALIADCRGAKVIDKLHRYQRDLHRTFDRALQTLKALQAQAAEQFPSIRQALDYLMDGPLPGGFTPGPTKRTQSPAGPAASRPASAAGAPDSLRLGAADPPAQSSAQPAKPAPDGRNHPALRL